MFSIHTTDSRLAANQCMLRAIRSVGSRGPGVWGRFPDENERNESGRLRQSCTRCTKTGQGMPRQGAPDNRQ
jgi:hypothetical protein